MVTITNYKSRENKKGEQFFVLELSGGIEAHKGENGMYFTSKKCTVPSSFTETQCKGLIGMEFPGSIQKQPCDPYMYQVPNSDKVIELNYRYVYVDNTTEVIEENIIDDANVI